jgi:hypothetical protein
MSTTTTVVSALSTAGTIPTYEAAWREYHREGQKVLVVAGKRASQAAFNMWTNENPGWTNHTGSLCLITHLYLPFHISGVRVYDFKNDTSRDVSDNIVPHLRRPDLELRAEFYPMTVAAWNDQMGESQTFLAGNQPELRFLDKEDIQDIIQRCKSARVRYEAVRDTEEARRLYRIPEIAAIDLNDKKRRLDRKDASQQRKSTKRKA